MSYGYAAANSAVLLVSSCKPHLKKCAGETDEMAHVRVSLSYFSIQQNAVENYWNLLC